MKHLISEIVHWENRYFPYTVPEKTDLIDFTDKLKEVADCFYKPIPCPLLIWFKM